jgi:hypothetical protein
MAQYEYKATLPDGRVVTRKSDRDYDSVITGYAGPKWREFHAAQVRKDIERVKTEVARAEHEGNTPLRSDRIRWIGILEERLVEIEKTDKWYEVGFAGNPTLAAAYVSRESKPSRGGFLWDDVKAIKVERRLIAKRAPKQSPNTNNNV